MKRNVIYLCYALLLVFVMAQLVSSSDRTSLVENNQAMFQQMLAVHKYSEAQMAGVKAIFVKSSMIGQGNPAITMHPVTPQECEAKVQQAKANYDNPHFTKICGSKYMAPLYDPAKQKPEEATACIDQFEFPDIPCVYPVTWVKAKEAAEICEAVGKRICDAHEWEGACAGALLEPDYRFDLAKGTSPEAGIRAMRAEHNNKYASNKSWSYGSTYRTGICACSSHKDPNCNGGSWTQCGTNTFPAGTFPDCHSSLGVYDLNGNAAEHMNLPLNESQMASRGSKTLGYTEMKGSWFIFDYYHAHDDWCRWRAPFWHGTRVMDEDSHRNYHLGFRCCKTIGNQAKN